MNCIKTYSGDFIPEHEIVRFFRRKDEREPQGTAWFIRTRDGGEYQISGLDAPSEAKRIPNTQDGLAVLSVCMLDDHEYEVWRLPIIAWDVFGTGDETYVCPVTIEEESGNERRAILDTKTGAVFRTPGLGWWRSADHAIRDLLDEMRSHGKVQP